MGRQAGQATTAILISVTALLLFLAVVFFSRLGRAEDQSGSLDAAGDAAALAGAQAIIADLPDEIATAIRTSGSLPGSLGQARASEFAERNGTSLIAYSYSPAADEIRVTVRSQATLATGQRETSTSTARIGLRLGPCKAAPRPTPSRTTPPPSTDPSASPTPTPTPTRPPDVATSYTCGQLKVPVIQPGGGGNPILTITPAALRAKFTPAISG